VIPRDGLDLEFAIGHSVNLLSLRDKAGFESAFESSALVETQRRRVFASR